MERRLLLIGDATDFMNALMTELRLRGFNIVHAADVQTAVAKLIDAPYTLLIADMTGPLVSRSVLCSEVRRLTAAPLLLMGKREQMNLLTECLIGGADALLDITLPTALLCEQIAAILRRISISERELVLRGKLRLDIRMARAFVDKQPINLSLNEFRTLLYLSDNSNRIVRKEELYEHVWGRTMPDDCTALWTVICRLKKKIKPYERDFRIESLQQGYRFVTSLT